MSSGSTSWNVSPKWKRISLTHWVTSPFGAMTSVRLTSPRSLSSRMMRPASMVLPRPTSSASEIAHPVVGDGAGQRPDLVRQAG